MFSFKQKTAYDMRSSDRSSDVCSSDIQRLCREGDLSRSSDHRCRQRNHRETATVDDQPRIDQQASRGNSRDPAALESSARPRTSGTSADNKTNAPLGSFRTASAQFFSPPGKAPAGFQIGDRRGHVRTSVPKAEPVFRSPLEKKKKTDSKNYITTHISQT